MSERTSITSREAVLASLLAHACLIIYALLFPETFRWSGRTPFRQSDPNTPIPLAFLQATPQAEPPEVTLGDAGREKISERRPPRAEPPENDDPYSEGNTRNRFVAPPLKVPAPPSPEPGPTGDAGASVQASIAGSAPEPAGRTGPGSDHTPPEVPRGANPFYTQPGGDPAGGRGADSRGGSLRDALGRMSAGRGVGGAPLKFDNPTGGLSGRSGGLTFDTPGFDWGPYARKIYWIIWSNWTRGWPPAAWAGLKGIVTIRFIISRDGSIEGITVVSPSGTPAFDTCATLALEASNPLPPLPEDFPNESEGITARFLYNTDDRDR